MSDEIQRAGRRNVRDAKCLAYCSADRQSLLGYDWGGKRNHHLAIQDMPTHVLHEKSSTYRCTRKQKRTRTCPGRPQFYSVYLSHDRVQTIPGPCARVKGKVGWNWEKLNFRPGRHIHMLAKVDRCLERCPEKRRPDFLKYFKDIVAYDIQAAMLPSQCHRSVFHYRPELIHMIHDYKGC